MQLLSYNSPPLPSPYTHTHIFLSLSKNTLFNTIHCLWNKFKLWFISCVPPFNLGRHNQTHLKYEDTFLLHLHRNISHRQLFQICQTDASTFYLINTYLPYWTVFIFFYRFYLPPIILPVSPANLLQQSYSALLLVIDFLSFCS